MLVSEPGLSPSPPHFHWRLPVPLKAFLAGAPSRTSDRPFLATPLPRSTKEPVNSRTEVGSHRTRMGSLSFSGEQAVSRSCCPVEAKVDNWRQAARQAIAWINYVDAAWMAFPKNSLRNVPRRDPYIARLGLIPVDSLATRGQAVRRPRSAKRRNASSNYRSKSTHAGLPPSLKRKSRSPATPTTGRAKFPPIAHHFGGATELLLLRARRSTAISRCNGRDPSRPVSHR